MSKNVPGNLTKRQVAAIDKKIEAHMNKVAKTRDDLDETIANLTHLRDNCDEAWDSLQRARDALSELV